MITSSLYRWLKQSRIVLGGGLVAIATTACNAAPPLKASTASAPPANPSTSSDSTAASPADSHTVPPAAPTQSTASSATSTSADAPSASQSTGQSTVSGESSPQAAAQVVRNYYSAINQKDYDQAYADWEGDGSASHQSFEQFKAGFNNTASTSVTVGEPNDSEGAAGSVFINVPVTVTAKTTGGASQQFRGSYVLRRVNDVDGSTVAQRTWHIHSADLKPVI